MNTATEPQLRPAVRFVIALAALVAILPWLSGGQDLIAQVITAALLLLGSLLAWRQPNLPLIGWKGLAIPAVGLLGWGALSLLWSANRYDSVLWSVSLLAAIAAFTLSFRLTQLPAGRRLLTRGYLVIAAVFALYGIYLYLTGDYERLTSTIYWANPAAAFLLPGVILAWDRASRPHQRRLFWPLSLLLLVAFWLTDSRGATLVLALTVIVFLLITKPKKKYWIHFLLIGLISYGLGIGFAQARGHFFHHTNVIQPGSRFSKAVSGGSVSGSDRIEYLKSAAAIWRDHPVQGSGAGTFGAVHPRYQNRVISAATDVHNWYVQVVSELGLVGGLLLVALLIMIGRGVWRGLRRSPGLLPWVAGLAALLLHLGLDIDASYPALLALAGVFVGLTWLPRGSIKRGRPSLVLPMALVVAFILVSAANTSQLARSQGIVDQANGDYAAAASDFARAHQTLVYDPATLNAEGIEFYTLASLGRDAKVNLALALDRAQAAERQAPSDSQNYQLEGRVRWAQGDLKGAEAAFRHALWLDPYNQPQYAYDLARLLETTGRSAEALRVTRAMVAQYPLSVLANRHNDPSVGHAEVNVLLLQARLEQAQGDSATATRDIKAAQALYKSLPAA